MSAQTAATKAQRPITPISTASVATDSSSEPSSPTSASSPQSPVLGSKPCSLCSTPRNVLIRCQIDDTSRWHFVCPGACLQQVNAGEGFYRYGGTWKNRHELVSAKVKGQVMEESVTGPKSANPNRRSRKMSMKDGRDLRAFMGAGGWDSTSD